MPPSRRARFVISIDLEMSWGSVHHGKPHDPSPYTDERRVVSDVLELMERHRISATWAIVGHLFLSECAAGAAGPHPELPRPQYPWLPMDWYELDPVSNVEEAPTWYGPDLAAQIRACAVPQEIGSHSFGHIIAGEDGCSADVFAADTAAAVELAAADGIELRSYVYPRNSIGHRHVLAEHGFVAYRGNTPDRFPTHAGWRRRILASVDSVWPLASATVQPRRDGALVDVPQTYLFDPASDTAERLGTRVWSRLVRRRLRHAVRTDSLFHLWFHTHNLAPQRERARIAMGDLFAEARGFIDEGRLENVTMAAVAAQIGDSS